jgi:hypothetical protein
MDQQQIVEWIRTLPQVQESEAWGYQFFFVGDDHHRPFATLADSDNEYDQSSQLHREGVFRINVGVRRETFEAMFPKPADSNTASSASERDYTVLNQFLPHPDYAAQHFLCVLNPEGDNVELLQQFVREAHALATERLLRKRG